MFERGPKPGTKESSSVEYWDPDPEDRSKWTVISQQHVGLEDNGVTKLDLMGLRAALRPPNCDPNAWPWADKSFPSLISEPRRSSGLFLEHLQGSKRPHPACIFKAHSRGKALKLKELWSRNGAPGQEPDYKFAFADSSQGSGLSTQKTFKSERDWRTPEVFLFLMRVSAAPIGANDGI